MDNTEKMAVLERALEEYRKSIRHFETYRRMMKGIGVEPIDVFAKPLSGDYDLHIFNGIEELAELSGNDYTDRPWSESYNTCREFKLGEFHAFELK